MSPKLPVVRAHDFIKALLKAGFVVDRQRGSHVILLNEENGVRLVVPKHHKDLKRGLLSGLLRRAGLSIEDLIKLL